MRKKLLSVMLTGAMIVSGISFTGCSNSSDSGNDTTTTTKDSDSSKTDEDVESEALQPATDPTWAENAVFYQLFVRSFYDSDNDGIGDFNGVAKKVDYLKELGVDAVWLMPIMKAESYHGYDVTDYREVEPDYGTIEDFQNMLNVLHENGIRVILDLVVNHTSDECEWFKEALNDKDSKYRNYYTIYEERPESAKGIKYKKDLGLYYYANYAASMPDLNYSNPEVRQDIKDITGYWLDMGIDGFRLDGAKEIDVDPNITHEWWKEFTTYVSEKNPGAFVVGESWILSMKGVAGYYSDMNSSFNFWFEDAVEKILKGGQKIDFATYMMEGRALYKEAAVAPESVNKYPIDSTMIDNHDFNRFASRVGGDIGKIKMGAALLLTSPGTPFIYYGDELGQLGLGGDPYKREGFDWNKSATGEGVIDLYITTGGAKAQFMLPDDGISYEEESADDNSVFSYYKKLISIRKDNKIMFTGDYKTIGYKGDLYAYTISGEGVGDKLLVVHNMGDGAASFSVKCAGENLMDNTSYNAADECSLSGYETFIFKYTADEMPVDENEFTLE